MPEDDFGSVENFLSGFAFELIEEVFDFDSGSGFSIDSFEMTE